jgi:hypothetical protein
MIAEPVGHVEFLFTMLRGPFATTAGHILGLQMEDASKHGGGM